MEFYASDSFLNALQRLQKKNKFYKSVSKDLKKEFSRLPHTVDEILKLGDVIYEVK